jgi:hypothetical protein
MKLFAIICLVPLCFLLNLQLPVVARATDAPIATEQAAAAIAEAAFLKHTKHRIKDYSVHAGKHTSTEWLFFIDGEKTFLRPGYQWIVTVNRKTGGAEVTDGL